MTVLLASDLPTLPSIEYLVVIGLLALVVNILFAIGIARHAKGRHTWLVGRFAWTAGTLLLGPFLAIGYWIVHESRLARPDGGERETTASGARSRSTRTGRR